MTSRRLPAALLALVLLATGCSGMIEVRHDGEVELARPAETSVVAAADGTLLADLHAEQDRDIVPLEAVPQVLRDAVVAVEDARFYEHGGVDARAVGRALLANVQSGGVAEGGSTITQQLAKLTVVGDARTVERKLAEASVALQLEAQFSKDEILERYLNTAYFGKGAYGVQTAARRYFGVDVGDLDLAQAATLAGLLKAPGRDDPLSNPDRSQARRDRVLDRMGALGLVDADAVAAAQAQPLDPQPPADTPVTAPYFVDHVLDVLQHDPEFAVLGDEAAERADRIFRGGLRVETTLDLGWQEAAEAAVEATLTHEDDPHAAVAAIDPLTGGIRALVGGRGYDDPDDPVGLFNLAVDGARQPGSTFKAIVLAAALSDGRSLDDEFAGGSRTAIAMEGGAGSWQVANYGGSDPGRVTLAEATALSVNTVYAELAAEVGPAAVADLAGRMGVRRDLEPLLSLALGAQEISVLELASVQATLASGGVYRPPSAVTRIVDPDGTVLYDRGRPRGERVLDEGVALEVTAALEGVIDHGTGQRADLRRPVAGKTGTSQDSADAWFAGYTPDLAAAVWIGFAEGRVPMTPPRTRVRVEGGNWPAELFARFGLAALDGTPARPFPAPRERPEPEPDVDGGPEEAGEPEADEPPVCEVQGCLVAEAPPATLAVPDVLGLDATAAAGRLEADGFSVTVREEERSSGAMGTVVRQAPSPGDRVPATQPLEVVLWVAARPRPEVTVPDVLGLPLEEARRLVEGAGLSVEVDASCPGGDGSCGGAALRPGHVREQTPDAGGRARLLSVVRLSVYPEA